MTDYDAFAEQLRRELYNKGLGDLDVAHVNCLSDECLDKIEDVLLDIHQKLFNAYALEMLDKNLNVSDLQSQIDHLIHLVLERKKAKTNVIEIDEYFG